MGRRGTIQIASHDAPNLSSVYSHNTPSTSHSSPTHTHTHTHRPPRFTLPGCEIVSSVFASFRNVLIETSTNNLKRLLVIILVRKRSLIVCTVTTRCSTSATHGTEANSNKNTSKKKSSFSANSHRKKKSSARLNLRILFSLKRAAVPLLRNMMTWTYYNCGFFSNRCVKRESKMCE